MRRPVNLNLILIAAVAAALLLFAAYSHHLLGGVQGQLSDMRQELGELYSNAPLEDVAGYALLFGGAAYGIGRLSALVFELTCVVLPAVAAVLMLIPAVMARVVYAPFGGRLLAYRILMGFSLVFLCLLGVMLLLAGLERLHLATLLGAAVLLGIAAVCIYGTYTGRVLL